MYATRGDQWFSYDNPYTMGLKAQYVMDNGLGGVMVSQLACRRIGVRVTRASTRTSTLQWFVPLPLVLMLMTYYHALYFSYGRLTRTITGRHIR